jgi:membrane-bound lytic murein transglycosylase D
MRSTGKLFLKIDDTIDERNDPIRATAAAADLLQGNYQALGSWPLALTAYNHGRLGMVRAVQAVKSSNIVDIIEHYKSSSFGFASSNFYAEFVAAKEIATHPDRYFDHAEVDKLVEFAEFVMTDYIDLKDLSTYSRIPLDVLQDLNPGLSDQVLQSKRLVPAGYVLRIPPEERDRFLTRYAEIPGYRKYSAQKVVPQRYIAQERKAPRHKRRRRR